MKKRIEDAATECEDFKDQEDVKDPVDVTSDLIVENETSETVTAEIKKSNDKKDDIVNGKRPRTGKAKTIFLI